MPAILWVSNAQLICQHPTVKGDDQNIIASQQEVKRKTLPRRRGNPQFQNLAIEDRHGGGTSLKRKSFVFERILITASRDSTVVFLFLLWTLLV